MIANLILAGSCTPESIEDEYLENPINENEFYSGEGSEEGEPPGKGD